jgi:hypothetical protein
MKLSELPDDIIKIIIDYMPTTKLTFLNKTYYQLYHHNLKKIIPLYDDYLRDVLMRDNDFVFDQILRENMNMFLKSKEYKYKYMIFSNYIYFAKHFCVEHNSENCKKILSDYLLNRDLCRNLHKKKVVKYIIWKN